jgi:hypothetical protein
MPRRLDVDSLRAAWWTARALRTVRRRLRGTPLHEIEVPAPPALPLGAERGVMMLLERRPHTCLERSFVLQRWLVSQGEDHDVVIGVTGLSGGFRAHAWVDGEQVPDDFHELTRIGSHAAG